ncbi:copper amine oxidase N-terminal domain-containing protein [Paenibacillus sp. 2003]|uniref:copper amine oxidase N-terminal domain-containing protein n=1 Tax=Paenibacillus sp. 2003 TaxID=2817761 RepID=UPI002859AD87|nr:copper amine oxidase N-terminal domain-containing protein [Paenibacillus sp. 2003]MDR6720890.1 hypothetical protein [Paenibacillus sp. 2003]
MLRKKLFLLLLVVSLFFVGTYSMVSASEVNPNIGEQFILQAKNKIMLVNGRSVLIDSTRRIAPVMNKGTLYIPAKNILRELGGVIEYDKVQKKITITLDDKVFTTYLGSKMININGTLKQVSNEPMLVNGIVWIPIRSITYGFDLSSRWDQINKRYIFYYGGLGERWYEKNYTTKVSKQYGNYKDQAIGYTINYKLAWGDPLVIQRDNETIKTIFYESSNLQIYSYSDYMLSSYSDEEGLILEESYEEYLYRVNLMSDDVREEAPGVVDKLYTTMKDDGENIVLDVISFKGDQVGVISIAVQGELSDKELKVLKEWQRLMDTSFKPDGSVG